MLRQMFNYKRWADQRTLDAVESIDQKKHPEAYAFALQQINHIVIVEELFKSRLTSDAPPHPSTNTDVVPVFRELNLRLKLSAKWYEHYVSHLGSLEEEIPFVFADGKRGLLRVEEILFHIVNHSSYHRGSIARALDLAHVPHPIDGYGIFIHETEPHRRDSRGS